MDISKEFASKFLNGQVLHKLVGVDGGMPIQIARVYKEEIYSPFTHRKELQIVVSFVGKELVLILKKTNALALAAILGNDTREWSKKWVRIVCKMVNSPDGMVPGVRFEELKGAPKGIKPQPAAQQQPEAEEAAPDDEDDVDTRPPGAKTGSLEINNDEFWFQGETPYPFSAVMLALDADDVDPDDPEFRAEATAWLKLQGFEDHEIPQPASPAREEDDTPPHQEPNFWPGEKGSGNG